MMRSISNLQRRFVSLIGALLLSVVCGMGPSCGPGLTPPRDSEAAANAGRSAASSNTGTKTGTGGAAAGLPMVGAAAGATGASGRGGAGHAGAGGSSADIDAGADDAGVP
jgi:hypothetical protein